MMIRTPDLLIPAADEVKRRLISAAMQVYKNDKYLLDYNVSERAITHRLAVYLEELFPQWHVDCEYNRDGADIKRVGGLCISCPAGCSERSGERVFPDVIVHLRGKNTINLLAIEAKKNISLKKCSFDLEKLKAYREGHLRYHYTAFINFKDTLAEIDFKTGQNA